MEALRGVPRAEIVAGPSRGGLLALGLARDEALAEEVELAVVLVHPPGPVHVLRLVRVDELRRRGGPVGGVVVEGHVVALELFVVVGAVVVAVVIQLLPEFKLTSRFHVRRQFVPYRC